MPERIQRQRTKGWQMPALAVYVGRPTLFGNPFPVDVYGAEGATDRFRRLLTGQMSTREMHESSRCDYAYCALSTVRKTILGRLPTLRGKTLACWCAPDAPCHADVLLELANAPQTAMREDHKMNESVHPQPEYDALNAFDVENNVEPDRTIAERVAYRFGFPENHPIIDTIAHLIEDARELGQRRGAFLPSRASAQQVPTPVAWRQVGPPLRDEYFTTRRSIAEIWEAQGADVRPLYEVGPPSPAPDGLREALMRIAFDNDVSGLAGNSACWPSTIAYMALGGRYHEGEELDTRESLTLNTTKPKVE